MLVKGIEIIPKSLSLYIQKKQKNPNAPWWVYKNHGERSDLRPARFLFFLPCKRFDGVGTVLTSENHTLPLTAALFAHFIRCQLSYCETG